VRQRAERNLRPYRAPHIFAGTLLCACHVPSEKNSVRHPNGIRRQPHWLQRERQPLFVCASGAPELAQAPLKVQNASSKGKVSCYIDLGGAMMYHAFRSSCAPPSLVWSDALAVAGTPQVCSNYISSGVNWEKASGAASSKRVNRLRNTNFTRSVGPLRCFAIRSSVSSRSSGVAPALKKCGR